MELDFVPKVYQIEAAQLSVRLSESIGDEVPEDIRAIASWPLDEAADARKPRAS